MYDDTGVFVIVIVIYFHNYFHFFSLYLFISASTFTSSYLDITFFVTLFIIVRVTILVIASFMSIPNYASLDGNEQYDSAAQVAELLARMRATPALARLVASILFVEQPIARKTALLSTPGADFRGNVLGLPVIVDESDGTLDTFVEARERGYTGVSSKTCKGLYKSILNAARCAKWNSEAGAPRYFMSAEDLTTQAGLAVQQDLALVNFLGITHVERNGHHYVNGMAAQKEAEQRAFLAAHPDLYEQSHGAVRLKIRQGRIGLASLDCAGYASAAMADFSAMSPIVTG